MSNVFPAGVISFRQWCMMPNGGTYMHAWARRWVVVTNAASGIPDFRSAERWHACAYDANGNILAVIPGCQVASYAAAAEPPEQMPGSNPAYAFKESA